VTLALGSYRERVEYSLTYRRFASFNAPNVWKKSYTAPYGLKNMVEVIYAAAHESETNSTDYKDFCLSGFEVALENVTSTSLSYDTEWHVLSSFRLENGMQWCRYTQQKQVPTCISQ